jgi:N12 class adenine-specific DNA methylase
VATRNTFLSSPFDNLLPEDAAKASTLPGQTPTKPLELPPLEQVQQAQAPQAEAPQAQAPQQADARQPARRANNLLPPPNFRPIFEAAAREFDVPVNVLMALGHQESRFNPQAIGPETQWGRARGMMQYLDSTAQNLGINPFMPEQAIPAAARQIRERLDKGYSMEDAIKEHFAGPNRKLWGPKTAAYGREVLDKTGQIAALLGEEQPQQPQGAGGGRGNINPPMALDPNQPVYPSTESPTQAAQAPNEPGLAGDIARMGIGGVYKGIGQIIEGAGKIPQIVGDYTTTPLVNTLFGTDYRTGNLLQKPGEAVKGYGESIQKGISQETAQAIKESTPDGNLLEPSTWTFGKAPSVRGYMALGADVLGSFVPVVAASVATAGQSTLVQLGTTGTVGGMQGGGAASQEAREAINEMAEKGTIEQESAYYRELLAAGNTPEQALAKTRDAAERWAFLLTAPISATGGMATQKILSPAEKIASRGNLPTRIAARAGLSGAEEGVQETVEGIQTAQGINLGAGTDIDPLEGTFGDFVLGAMGGSGPGAVAGAVSPRDESARPEQPSATPAAEPQGDTGPAAAAATPPVGRAEADESLAKRSTAAGPLTRAAENAAEDVAPDQRVTVTAPEGQITGFVESYQADGQGGFSARILGDDGMVYNFTHQDGVQIDVEAPTPGPLTSSVEAAISEQTASEQVAPEQVAPVAIQPEPVPGPFMDEGAMPAVQPAEPAPAPAPAPAPEIALTDMSEAELRARLKYIADQAKAAGGWNKRFIEARREVEREINARAKPAEVEAPQPATVLPRELAGAKPRYSFGAKQFDLSFASDFDKAAYITSQATPSKRDADYLQFAMDAMGLSEAEVRAHGQKVREAIKAQARDAEPGTLDVAEVPRVSTPTTEGASNEQTATPTTEPQQGQEAAQEIKQDQATPARDQHAGKWFGSRDKADAYIAKRGIAGTHEVEQTGKVRFEIKPKGTANDNDRANQQPASAEAVVQEANEGQAAPATVQSDARTNEREEEVSAAQNVEDAPQPAARAETEAQADQAPEAARGDAAAAAGVPDTGRAAPVEAAGVTPAEPMAASSPATLFANNKVFTADKVEAARARLRSKLNQINSGIDPEVVIDGMTIAGAYIEAGVRKFSDYAKAMTDDFGDAIKPYLLSFYEAARNYPGIQNDGMTSVEQAKAEHTALLKTADTTEVAEALGETVAKPAKRTKKTGAKTDMTLTQDWGVEHIDGYGMSADRETGNDVKDAFLKEAKAYLNTVAGILAEEGFTPYTDAKGRPQKPVSVNESGAATSGDVSLTLDGPNGVGVYATIGGTSLRGAVPTSASGISLMVRVAQAGDKFGTKDRNRWMPVDLSAADLAQLMLKAVSEFKPRAEGAQNARPVQPEPVPAGNPAEARTDAAPGDRDSEPLGAGMAGGRQGTLEGGQVPGSPEGAGTAGTRGSEPAGQQPPGTPRDSAGVRPDAGTADNAADFVIDADEIGKGGLVKKYRDNVAAIRLLKALETEGRTATPDERKQLAKYVGWGAMKGPFDPENKQWSKQHAELKELLTPDEFRAARKSTLDAHYTSPVAVGAMNNALRRLGYKGGRMLESSVGIGNFFGLMPADMRNNSQLYGVELDSLTSRMVAALYPKAKIAKATGFEDFEVPSGFFDLNQGNPPFGSQPLVDKDRSPYSGFSIHNYFLAKGIDKVRPGGIVQVVVSHSFLDAQDSRARQWIAERANLIGAVRLPNTAFKENAGTEVVTDILIFQKKDADGQAAPNVVDGWVNVVDQVNTNPQTGESATHKVSSVFAKRPDLVLGKPSAGGSMYRANEYTVEQTGDIKPMLDAWVETLPQGIYTPIERKPVATTDMAVPDGVKVGSYYVDANGEIMQRGEDVLGSKSARAWTSPNAKATDRMKGMIGLRETLRNQMRLERSPDATEADIEANRATLNKQYDAFLKKHGHVNSPTNRRLFMDDTESQLIQALEFDYDKGVSSAVAEKEGIDAREPSATKADIFKRRVAFPPQDFLTVTTAKDALLASLNYRGKVDGDYMAEVYGKPMDKIVDELGDVVYEDPQAGIVTADEYLSGDVKTKLAEAQAAAQDDAKYKRNVAALEKVIPADKKPSEITVSIGAAFVPADIYQQFVKHISGGDATAAYIKATGQWLMDFKGGTEPALNTGKFGTDQLSAQELFQLSMLGRGAVVKKTMRNPDGSTTTIVMEKETEAAREKQNAIKAEWQSWLWNDPARTEQIAALYNDKLNRIVPRTYDGSHLSFPGMNPAINLLEHQKNGVWRGLQSYQVLYDHVVGAGKTFEMATLAMEMRRLGIARKPLFVVPNHLTLQWRSEFTRLYPGSNILAATPEDFAKGNRERMFSKIVTGDWDAVVVGHSSLKKIGLPEATEKAVLQEQIDEVAQAIEDMKRTRGDRNIIRDMEGIRSRLEAKMKDKLAAIGKRDKVVTFDELGIDAMFIDEMHEFKNLAYNSTMDRNPGMGNPNGSAKAFDLFVKTRWLFDTFGEKTPYITATGTPVSNSLVEMYNMQRYMQYPTLKAEGLHVFDAWAKQFGSVENVYEVAPSGSGYRQSTRFSKFANLPGLMSLYNSFADTITLDDLKAQEEAQGKRFPVPKMVGGKPQIVVAQRSPAVANLMGVPMAQTNEDGSIKFLADLNGAIQIDQKADTGKWTAKVGDSYLGEFDTEQDARLKIVERALTPEVTVAPESILGRFANLKQLTKETKGKVNALSLTGEANKAGLDYRLVNPAAPDFPGSKINKAVDNMVRIHKQWASDKGTQLVFCDLSIPLSARASYSSKARRLYVRNDAGAVDMKRGTMHTLEGQESLPYFVVQRGEKDLKRFDVFDAASGAIVGRDFRSKQDAIDDANRQLADADARQAWIERREQAGEIAQEQIDEYNNENDIEADGIEAFTREDIAGVSGAAKFSVYDDIKAKLIAKGIPEREIAFIHDYATPTAKDKLFKAVNSGEIRFLLGSTPKMGAGTNVQKRLVGLHHIDAPWRPSDLEQREGRIIRRGNELYDRDPEGFEVFVGRYATEQTYDTRRWQILEHKARGIEQLRNFDGTINEIDDIEGEAANAADMKAAASGDPLILEETRLKNDVRRLEQLQAAHADDALAMNRKAKSAEDFAKTSGPRLVAEYTALADAAKKHPLDKEGFAPVTVDGKTYPVKEAAQEEIGRAMSVVRSGLQEESVVVYRGVEFTLMRNGNVALAESPTGTIGSWAGAEPFSASGFVQRMKNYVDRLPAAIDDVQAKIDKAEKDAGAMREQAKTPFAQAADLEAAREEYKRVQRALLAKGPAVPESQKPAVASGIEAQKQRLKSLGFGDQLREFFESTQDQTRYSVRPDGTPEAEFGPVFTGMEPQAAIDRLIGEATGEAIVTHPELGDVSLVYGDDRAGLQHIAERRGDAILARLPGLLAEGKVYTKPGQEGRVFVGTDRDEAVLRLDWNGQAKTWLLSAYEKYPDLKAGKPEQMSRRSQTVARRSEPGLTVPQAREAMTTGIVGPVISRLIDNGTIVLHASTKTLPKGIGRNVRGVQAVTTPDGKVHVVAAAIDASNARAVTLHEMFHQGTEKLIGTEQWGKLMGRLGSLYRQSEQSNGKAKEFFDRARERVAAAKRQNAVATRMEVEEFGAYAIEEYERSPESLPAAIRKWVEDLIGMVKAYMVKRFGKQLGQVTPAQLSALAKLAVMDMAVDGAMPGRLAFSAADPVDSPAFKRWFGKSKVVDAAGKPLVVYHGTDAEFFAFDMSPGAFFTDSKTIAKQYAERRNGSRIEPVYLSMQKPFIVEAAGDMWDDVNIGGMNYDQATLKKIFGAVSSTYTSEQIVQAVKKSGLGFDGVIFRDLKDAPIGKARKSDVYAIFDATQAKSATGNTGDFDPANPDIRYSIKPEDADKAIDEAIDGLEYDGPIAKDDYIGRAVTDLGLFPKLLTTPRTIAAIHPEFAPVYTTAISQMETRDTIVADLGKDVQAYDALPQASKENVNRVLELGRQTSTVYTAKELAEGVTNTGSRNVVIIGDNGKPKKAKVPITSLLTQPGEIVTLTADEIAAYQDLRNAFDRALDMMRDQTLEELGFPELKGKPNASQAIRDLITDKTPKDKVEALENIAKFVAEIEQAKRAGYVPFSRYGDYVVTVKEKIANLDYTPDGQGNLIVGNVPASMAEDLLALGATQTPAGDWTIRTEQKKDVEKLTEQTVYSTKVETGIRDFVPSRKARTVEDIPAVRQAIEKARREYVGNNPARRIVAFKTHPKKQEGPVRLSDVDSLAEIAGIDNQTWDAVRDKLADAIKSRSFRKHFFHSDNVPGYTADFERSISDYVIGMAGYLSRRQHMKRWDNAVNRITDKPKLAEYAGRYRQYVNDPQEEYAMLRQIGFFSYIAGVLATAGVNLTQVPVATIPTLNQFAPAALVAKEVTRAYADAVKMMGKPSRVGLAMFDPAKAPEDVREALTEAWNEGAFVPLETLDLMMTARQRNVGARKGVKAFNKTVQVTAIAFTYAERLNRLVTFIAAARMSNKPAVREKAHKVLANNALARQSVLDKNWTPKNFAEWMVDETQFRLGKANRARMMSGVGAPITQFKSFMLNYFELLYRMAALHGKEGKLAFLASTATVVALGGLWGFPGADDLRKLIEAMYRQITDKDLDVKTEMRQWVAETSGSAVLAQMVNKGLSYPAGVDLTRVGLGTVIPDSSTAALGIPYDLLIGRPTRAFQKATNGDVVGALAELTPNFAKNMIVAANMKMDGVRDRRGQRIMTPDELGPADIALRAAGFQPSKVTDVRDYEYAQRRRETAVDDLKRGFLNKMARTIAAMETTYDPKELAKLENQLANIYQEIEEHNATASQDEFIEIGKTALQNRIARELEGVRSTWGRERKNARGSADEMRKLFGLEEGQ